MQQDGHDLLSLLVSTVELLSLDLALDDWITGFEVRGIGDDGQPAKVGKGY